MRPLAIIAALLLAACAPAPRQSAPAKADAAKTGTAKADPTAEPWYGETIEQLKSMNHDAGALVRAGKSDEAAAIITKTQPLANRLLSAPKPTLPALKAVSDSDQLYGRMLLANKNYGWARLLFQKDASRWKTWQPQTPDTARRLALARDGIAECDRHL